jgi:membrane protein
MWLVAKPFSEGKPAPQQEVLEHQLRVPGEVTRALSDKLIRAGLLTLAGSHGDRLVPGRALDLITIGEVLRVVRHDEDRIIDRLPKVIPVELMGSRTFAELLRGGDGLEKPGSFGEPEPVSVPDR